MRTTLLTAAVLAAATATALALAGPAAASDTIASDAAPVVLAQDTSPAPVTIPASIVGIDADLVGGLTVTGHQGRRVTAAARGRTTRSVTVAAGRPAVLKGLTPGVRYTVTIGGRRVGTAIPLAQVGAASGLRVETTGTPGTVAVSWAHTAATGEGPDVTFDVTATPLNADSSDGPAFVAVTAATSPATLTGLATDVRYRFTVTPRNTASTGRPTSATMTRTLAELATSSSPIPVPAVTVPATPAAAAAPAPAPSPPATKTIYVCPDGYPETTSGLCQKTLAYTFDVRPYTQHWGIVGWHSVDDVYAANVGPLAQGPVCPWGGVFDGVGLCVGATSHRVDDYGWIKDPTPTGYTDTGTTWRKKNPTPTGYTDDGTQWVTTVAKIPKVVPA